MCAGSSLVCVLVLNDAAWRIVEAYRGQHSEFVFVYRPERVKNFDQVQLTVDRTTLLRMVNA